MRSRFIVQLAALASTCWIGVGQALAENRLALVIGNSDYTSVTVLPNPANDAKAMANFLSSAGFEVVQAPNLTQNDMRRTIGAFASKVAEKGPDTVALVFYAGHGLQVDGENFLVPVDAQIERETDVPLQSMRLADLMNALSSVPSKIRLVILDACRNNPFSAINRTTGRGLAIVDAPNGSLVSYSTAPGTEALDGDGVNSPYTTALLQIGKEPGLPVEQVLKRVRLAVSGATNQQQFPWESSSLTSEFSFIPAGAGQEKPTMASAGQPGKAGTPRSETRTVEFWRKELKSKHPRDAYEVVILEDRVEVYQAYLALYPSESMAPVVRSLFDRRQMMIAWYNTVTLNTPVAYQAFLAGYGSSDFAATANRLLERALARSVANATAAFAYGPACPCNPPATPTRRQKRTNLGPTQTPGPNPISTAATPTNTPVTPTGPGTSVTVVDPPPVTVYTDPGPPILPPPVITVPIDPRPPRVHIPPRPPRDGRDKRPDPSGQDKSTGGSTDDKPPSGHDKQKPTGVSIRDKHDKPKVSAVPTHDEPRITRGRNDDRPRIRIKNPAVHTPAKSVKSFSPPASAARVTPRVVTPRVSVVPRQSLGLGMARNPLFGGMNAPRVSSGRMGGGHAAPRMSPGIFGGGRIMGFGR
jgi:hypothetical protein